MRLSQSFDRGARTDNLVPARRFPPPVDPRREDEGDEAEGATPGFSA